MRTACVIIVASLSILAACGGGAPPGETLLVAAAANLQFALGEIGELYADKYGEPPVFTYGSSGSLAHQIENGAPFDIYLSANESFINRLAGKGFFDPGDLFPTVDGSICIGLHESVTVPVRTLEDLVHGDIRRIAVASPVHAPYGAAAVDAIQNAGLTEQLQPKIVYAETIRQCLQFVETGNAEAGIVSANVPPVEHVRYVPVDTALYAPPAQKGGILKNAANRVAARRFVEFLGRPECRAVFKKYNYCVTLPEKRP